MTTRIEHGHHNWARFRDTPRLETKGSVRHGGLLKNPRQRVFATDPSPFLDVDPAREGPSRSRKGSVVERDLNRPGWALHGALRKLKQLADESVMPIPGIPRIGE